MPVSSFFYQDSFFSALLKNETVNNLLDQAVKHSFNEQLFSGRLNHDRFADYLNDDLFYLQEYSKSIHRLITRARVSHPERHALFDALEQMANTVIDSEQSMREQFKVTTHKEPGHAIRHYVDFLQKYNQEDSLAVAFASIVPCFWVYLRIGQVFSERPPTGIDSFDAWIATYRDQSFEEVTYDVIRIVNDLALDASQHEKDNMTCVFLEATQHEIHFFDSVMREELSPSLAATC